MIEIVRFDITEEILLAMLTGKAWKAGLERPR